MRNTRPKRRPKTPKSERLEELNLWFTNDLYLTHRMLYIGKPVGEDEENELTAATAENILKGLWALAVDDPDKPVTIILNNIGGSLYDALAIYDAIKVAPFPVIIKAFGACMSAATIVLQAGTERVISPNCTLMIHAGEDGYHGHPTSFLRWAKAGLKLCEVMYKIYAACSGKPADFWRKKCDHDLILTASEAIELGLADRLLQLPTKKIEEAS